MCHANFQITHLYTFIGIFVIIVDLKPKCFLARQITSLVRLSASNEYKHSDKLGNTYIENVIA